MIRTTYNRHYVAQYSSAPVGDSELHEWKLCRDKDNLIRHWHQEAEAGQWIDDECNGDREKKRQFIVVSKSVSFEHAEPAKIVDIGDLLTVVS